MFRQDKREGITADIATQRLAICSKPVEISSYAFWVKCAPVSAHIRFKEANLSTRPDAGSNGKFNRLHLTTFFFACSRLLLKRGRLT